MDMIPRTSQNSSVNESQGEEEFQDFKTQLIKVQNLIDQYNSNIVDKSLCADDLTTMDEEMKLLTLLEQKVTSEKMKSSYISYKALYLKMVQESYRICSWLMEKEYSEMDNVFDIESFVDKIFEACNGKKFPLSHLNTLFKGVMKNTDYFNLNFYGNIKPDETNQPMTMTQSKKEIKRSQKRPVDEQVVPDEVENGAGDNELQITLLRVNKCLKRAVAENGGRPVPFYKFAIDPFSLTYTVENLFHLASLVKDRCIKIERVDGVSDEFTTITVIKKKSDDGGDRNSRTNKNSIISSLFTINEEIWKDYVKKYNITERMIDQD